MDGDFRVISYSEIDLTHSEELLKSQGLLKVDLGWLRARTMMVLLEQDRKLRVKIRPGLARVWRMLNVLIDLTYLLPLTFLSSKLVELHCIFVNHCHHAEWEKLPNGKYRFTFL